jgi:predicted SAM-dependent methyltransferase
MMSIRREREILVSYAPDDKFGLNLGCRNVRIGKAVGIDRDPHAQAVDVVGDVVDLSKYMTGTVDYIVALHILEHMTVSPRLVLNEWNRVLKQDGTLAVIVPDAENMPEQLGTWSWIPNEHRDQHFCAFSPKILKDLFICSGFEVIRLETIWRDPIRPEPTLLCVGIKKVWYDDRI